MMEKIDINDTGVVDSIRNKMAVATVEEKGLMGAKDRKILMPVSIYNNKSNSIDLGRVYGLLRFVLWSDTNKPSLYIIDAVGKTVEYFAGYNISLSSCSFRVASSEHLILNYNGEGTKTIHIEGVAEEIR